MLDDHAWVHSCSLLVRVRVQRWSGAASRGKRKQVVRDSIEGGRGDDGVAGGWESERGSRCSTRGVHFSVLMPNIERVTSFLAVAL